MDKIAIGLFILLWIQIFFIEKVASACNCVSDGTCNGNCGGSCFYVRKFNPVFNSRGGGYLVGGLPPALG